MKKRSLRLLTAALALAMLTGCGAASNTAAQSFAASPMKDAGYAAEYYEDYSYAEAEEVYVNGSYSKDGESVKLDDTAATDRKLIKNVSLEVETKAFDAMMSTLESQVSEFGGYIENMDSYNGSNYSGRKNVRYANLTIRIPQNKLGSFLTTVSENCNVIRRNDSVNDVTLSYVDTQSRRDALKVEQERLLEMLKVADNLEDMLILEERMTNVRYQLESYESQLRSLDNKVTYSTVSLKISEVEELTPVVVEEPTAMERMTEGFKESIKDVTNAAVEFAIWFVSNLPKLIIWAIVIFVIVMIVKAIRRKKNGGKKSKKAVVSASETVPAETESDK